MHPFHLQTVPDEQTAIRALQDMPDARILAGGTNLIDLMKLTIERPSHLIDITAITGLNHVGRDADGNLRIGALATMSDVADHALVRSAWPMVSQALEKGASAQLRNMATIGGNLLQRTRCPYFRGVATRCNKRAPGSGCDALEGMNREHALLGTSAHCIALHPSDLCIALAALETQVEISGPEGRRSLPFERLHRPPGNTPEVEHNLLPGELITAIVVSPSETQRNATYLKIRDRESYQFAVVSVAAALDLDGDRRVREARIALGGVATTPWRARAVEDFLQGRRLDDDTLAQAGEVAMTGATARRFNAFKIPLMKGTIVTALSSLRAGEPR